MTKKVAQATFRNRALPGLGPAAGPVPVCPWTPDAPAPERVQAKPLRHQGGERPRAEAPLPGSHPARVARRGRQERGEENTIILLLAKL